MKSNSSLINSEKKLYTSHRNEKDLKLKDEDTYGLESKYSNNQENFNRKERLFPSNGHQDINFSNKLVSDDSTVVTDTKKIVFDPKKSVFDPAKTESEKNVSEWKKTVTVSKQTVSDSKQITSTSKQNSSVSTISDLKESVSPSKATVSESRQNLFESKQSTSDSNQTVFDSKPTLSDSKQTVFHSTKTKTYDSKLTTSDSKKSKNSEGSVSPINVASVGISLLAGYGDDSDDEQEEEIQKLFPIPEKIETKVSHSTLFPVTNHIDPQQFEVAPQPPTTSVFEEPIDTKAFQRKRRIGIDLVNTVRRPPEPKEENNTEESKHQGLGFKASEKEYPGFKSGGVLFVKSESADAAEAEKEESVKNNEKDEKLTDEIETIQVTLKEKLGFLCEGRDPALPVQVMIIQLEVRNFLAYF